MNRAEMIQQLAVLEQLTAAIRGALKAEAEAEFDGNGMVPSWKASDGTTVVGSMRHDRCEVLDADAFMAYLVEHYPQLVHTVVVPRDPKVVAALLAEVAESGPAPDPATGVRPVLAPGGTAPNAAHLPGVVFVQGGQFNTVTIKVDDSTKSRIKVAAVNYLAGTADAFDVARLFRSDYGA